MEANKDVKIVICYQNGHDYAVELKIGSEIPLYSSYMSLPEAEKLRDIYRTAFGLLDGYKFEIEYSGGTHESKGARHPSFESALKYANNFNTVGVKSIKITKVS